MVANRSKRNIDEIKQFIGRNTMKQTVRVEINNDIVDGYTQWEEYCYEPECCCFQCIGFDPKLYLI